MWPISEHWASCWWNWFSPQVTEQSSRAFPTYILKAVLLKTYNHFCDQMPGENSDCTEGFGVMLVSSELAKSLIAGVPLAQQAGVLWSDTTSRKRIVARCWQACYTLLSQSLKHKSSLLLLLSPSAALSFETSHLPSFAIKCKCFFTAPFTITKLWEKQGNGVNLHQSSQFLFTLLMWIMSPFPEAITKHKNLLLLPLQTFPLVLFETCLSYCCDYALLPDGG